MGSGADRPEGEELLLEREGDLAVVRLRVPKLYVGGAAERVGKALLESARRGEFRKLLIDFTQVEGISSALLGTLAVLYRILQKQGGVMRIFGLGEGLERVFEIARLRDLFGIDPDEETARSELERHP